jgi:hypothetical protein
MSVIPVETVNDDDETIVTVPKDESHAQEEATSRAESKLKFRSDPMTWDELVDIITVQNALEKLVRSEEKQREYMAFVNDLKLEWASVSDHILCSKFPKIFTKQLDKSTQRYVAHPPIKDVVSSGNSYMAVVRNDFPYHMENGIEHWILWKVGDEPVAESEIEHAKSLLSSRLGDDMLHWLNPSHLKSLPEIDHIHILGKLIEGASEVPMVVGP